MDPNETLRELRGMISDAQDFNADIDGDLMAEKFEALDTWLARGGFLPEAWRRREYLADPTTEPLQRYPMDERGRAVRDEEE